MITIYHRPKSIEEALQLLGRTAPRTVPLGGGTLLSHPHSEAVEVVDLQALGLGRFSGAVTRWRPAPRLAWSSCVSMQIAPRR